MARGSRPCCRCGPARPSRSDAIIRILLAEDHRVVRQGLRALLESVADFQVVGEASDGLEAIDLTQGLRPDVLVTDLVMPSMGGLDVASVLARRVPSTRVVILSMHSGDAYVAQALRSGASAYVLKDSGFTELVMAVRAAAAGRRHLSPPFSEQRIADYLERSRAGEIARDETLTPREREVLCLEAGGLTAGQIGERLSISPRTAEAHRANVMRKLGIHSKAELIRFCITRGIGPGSSQTGAG